MASKCLIEATKGSRVASINQKAWVLLFRQPTIRNGAGMLVFRDLPGLLATTEKASTSHQTLRLHSKHIVKESKGINVYSIEGNT